MEGSIVEKASYQFKTFVVGYVSRGLLPKGFPIEILQDMSINHFLMV